MSQDLRQSLLAELTPAQRQVVTASGPGPIKVAAAAGSGKTKTMATLYAMRVLDGLRPGEILAVTFTDRAAAELRQRVAATLEAAGAVSPDSPRETLEGAWIGTFHTLARRLLAEQAYLAGVPGDLALVDEVEARVLLEASSRAVRTRLADPSGLGRWLPERADPKTLLGLLEGATSAVTRIRSTELDRDDLRRLSLDAYRRFQESGDPASELVWDRCALEVVEAIWEDYEGLLADRRAVDFDGLLRQALVALRSSPRLAAWCRSEFRLLIVDEYQDTSAVQSGLLELLAGPGAEKMFVVGDARQSIYAFRDAEPGIMVRTPGREFALFRNHRSLAPILAAADHVIGGDPQFASDPPMELAREEEGGAPVLLGLAPGSEQEAEGIASLLLGVHRGGLPQVGGGRRPVGYGEMAVLAHSFKRLGPFLEESLRRRGIPFQTATGALLERPELKDAMALIRVVLDASADRALVRVLQSAWVRMPDREMVRLAASPAVPGASLEERVRSGLERGLGPQDRILAERLVQLLDRISELRRLARVRPAAEVLSALLEESGMLPFQEALARARPTQGERSLAALRDLHRIALAAGSGGRWVGLGDLLERLEAIAAGSGRPEPPPLGGQDLVTLSTIHRAKGLEWPVVVLADCRPYHARPQPDVIWDRRERALVVRRIGGADSAAGLRWKSSADAQVPAEEHRRLVYVAMTRARDLLVVTSTAAGVRGHPQDLGQVMDQIWAGEVPRSEYGELVKAAAVPEAWVRLLSGFPERVRLPWEEDSGEGPAEIGPAPIVAKRRVEAALRERVFATLEAGSGRQPDPGGDPPPQLSFSSLRTLERCPRQFWFQQVAHFQPSDPGLALPEDAGGDGEEAAGSGRGQALELGSLVHAVLERFHRIGRASGSAEAELLALLEAAAAGVEAGVLEEARQMLTGYARLGLVATPTLAVEVGFRWRGWAGPGVPDLVGTIDRLARPESEEPILLDYKTNLDIGEEVLNGYSRQLGLYAAALEAGILGSPLRVGAAALVLLRAGEVVPVDCGESARRQALEWAAALARPVLLPSRLSGLDHPLRPCPNCWFRDHCPERREQPGPGAGSAAQAEELG